MTIRVKRVYDKPEEADGLRILVDRLWPRGLSRDKVKIDLWLKEVAPSDGLRKWFSHDAGKWAEFKRRYFDELNALTEPVDVLTSTARQQTVTLLFGAKDERYNNAVALREYIVSKRRSQAKRAA